MRKFSQPQNPNPMDLRVQRWHTKREGKVERDIARVFYRRLSPVLLKIQFNYLYELGDQLEISRSPAAPRIPNSFGVFVNE